MLFRILHPIPGSLRSLVPAHIGRVVVFSSPHFFCTRLLIIFLDILEIDGSFLSLTVCPSPILTYYRLTRYSRIFSFIRAVNMRVSRGYFKGAINTAVEQRVNTYRNSFAPHVHFEDHNTNADQDEKSFHALARLLGVRKPESYVIPGADSSPSKSLRARMEKFLRRPLASEGSTMIILRYSGHGYLSDEKLNLINSSGMGVELNNLLEGFVPDHYITEDCRLDFAVLFDCGISFPPVAVRRRGPRRVDVLSTGWNRLVQLTDFQDAQRGPETHQAW